MFNSSVSAKFAPAGLSIPAATVTLHAVKSANPRQIAARVYVDLPAATLDGTKRDSMRAKAYGMQALTEAGYKGLTLQWSKADTDTSTNKQGTRTHGFVVLGEAKARSCEHCDLYVAVTLTSEPKTAIAAE